MAKREQVIYSYTCDICGKDAEESHTVTFGDGSRPAIYEIDLCGADSKKLAKAEDALKVLLGNGRKSGGNRQRASSGRAPRGSRRRSPDAGTIREWARANGYEVSDRGRISTGIAEAYASAK